MATYRVFKEENLLKYNEGKFVCEVYKTRRDGFFIRGLCMNSSPIFCRQEVGVPKESASWMQVLNENSTVLKRDGVEEDYNKMCPKVAWGISAYLLYNAHIDNEIGLVYLGKEKVEKENKIVVYGSSRPRAWYDRFEIVPVWDLFKAYKEFRWNYYKATHVDYHCYYRFSGKFNDFDAEFLEYHINEETTLLKEKKMRMPKELKAVAKEYINWLKIELRLVKNSIKYDV